MITRVKLAWLLLTPALLLVAATVVATAMSLSSLSPDPTAATDAGLARVGDDLALVIVTGGDPVPGLRSTIADWGLLIPAIGLIGAAMLAWTISGRVYSVVVGARDEVTTADSERESRLQEVVHELRTPLAVMGTNLELAQMEGGDETSAERYIGAARRAVGRMSRTVDDLAGHGRLAIDHNGAPVDLATVAVEAVAEHVGPARTRGVHVLHRGNGKVLVPAVDRAALQAAIGNFLANAVRLAPRGSAITVGWGEVDEWAWIAVSDEGPGLAQQLHARAFERGWQGAHDRDRNDGNEGAGLGLTIARQLTEAQGGVVTLASEEGGGTTLAVWLPLEHGAEQRSIVSADGVHPVVEPWTLVPVTA